MISVAVQEVIPVPGCRKSVLTFFRVVPSVNAFRGAEKGTLLVEALFALVLLGIIAAALLGGLATASKAVFIADEGATAESLARSQVEYVKSQAYIDYADPGHGYYELIATPANYSVEMVVVPVDPATGQPLPSGQDNGIQKITVTVSHDGEQVITLNSYRVE